MADAQRLAYFAGFFDGEGCVGIYAKKYVVSLTNTDIRPLQMAKDIWGGSISCQVRDGREFAIQDLWRWQIYGHSSRKFLEEIREYTVIKRPQIDCYLAALEYVPTRRGKRRKSGANAFIGDAISKLKLMKKAAQNG